MLHKILHKCILFVKVVRKLCTHRMINTKYEKSFVGGIMCMFYSVLCNILCCNISLYNTFSKYNIFVSGSAYSYIIFYVMCNVFCA